MVYNKGVEKIQTKKKNLTLLEAQPYSVRFVQEKRNIYILINLKISLKD
ncbi:hypothetical protein [Niallia sp. Krafla_26]